MLRHSLRKTGFPSLKMTVILVASFYLLFNFVFCAKAINANEGVVDRRVSVSIMDRKCLSAALQIVGRQLNCIISYEDPSYQFPSTYQALTPDGPTVPVLRKFNFNFDPTQPKLKIIQDILDQYHMIDDTVIFKVGTVKVGTQDTFYVFPFKVMDHNGKLMLWASSLESKISLSTTGTYLNVVSQITALMSQKNNQTIRVIPSLGRYFDTEKISFNADDKSVAACINSIICQFNSKYGTSLQWGIFRSIIPSNTFLWFSQAPRSPTKVIALSDGGNQIEAGKEFKGDRYLHISSSRPLGDTLKILAAQLSKTIVFEDPPHLCPCETIRDKNGKPYMLGGATFDFAYQLEQKPEDVLSSSIESYDFFHPGKFKLKKIDNTFYIYPTEYGGEDASIHTFEPLLETRIAIPTKQQTIGEFLKSFCATLAIQTNQKIEIEPLPPLSDFQQKVPDMPSNLTAAEYLAKLSKLISAPMSWQLLYDPIKKSYEFVTKKAM